MPTDDPELFVPDLDEGQLGIAVERVVTQAFFNSIISKAAPSCAGKKFYTRSSFLNAAKSYSKFGKLANDAASKREIAAFFAHVTHETGRKFIYIIQILLSSSCVRACITSISNHIM
ncbi:Endochitinase EP3 [Linum perenne]